MFESTEVFQFTIPVDGTPITRYADPLAIRRRLLIASSGRLWEWTKAARGYQKSLAELGDAEGEEADAKRAEWSARVADLEGLMVDAAYAAFDGFVPLDPETGRGVTEIAALSVLGVYLEWLEQKKRTLDPSPT